MSETELEAWGRDVRAALCPRCDWAYLLPAERSLPAAVSLPRCPHCFGAELVSLAEDVMELPTIRPPELVLPFEVRAEALAQQVTRFAEGIPYPPEDLNPQTLRDRLQPIYLPLWLVDVEAAAAWQAEAGFNYEVVRHQEQYSDAGSWRTHQAKETRIRWEPRAGRLQRRYDNLPVPALEDAATLERALGRYRLEAARPYAPNVVDHGLVRLPNRLPADAWRDAEPVLQAAAAAEVQQAARANHIRDFRWAPQVQSQHWTLMLKPLYTTFYHDDAGAPQPVLIHGQTGQVSGVRRASAKRAQKTALILGGIAAAVLLLSLLALVVSIVLPPLAIMGALGIILVLILGCAALIPLVRAWNFNRKNT